MSIKMYYREGGGPGGRGGGAGEVACGLACSAVGCLCVYTQTIRADPSTGLEVAGAGRARRRGAPGPPRPDTVTDKSYDK